MTKNDAILVATALAKEYVGAVTPDAKVGIHNALHGINDALPYGSQASTILLRTFTNIVWEANK